jgi:hypothetical protein
MNPSFAYRVAGPSPKMLIRFGLLRRPNRAPNTGDAREK